MLRIEQCSISHEKELYRIPLLELKEGELVGLIGANGAGKSTLMEQLIKGQIKRGMVTFQGRNWNDLTLQERAKTITLVDNHFLGLDYLRVSEYLELGRHTYTNFTGRLGENDLGIVAQYVELLGLYHLLDQPTSTLSDGERQRVGIAKALIQETPIVLLDEPTAFLDYPTKKMVMSLLKKISSESNRLLLIASHDLEFCLEYCSRLLVIEKESKELASYNSISLEELVYKAFGI